jgi:hypothetical protein
MPVQVLDYSAGFPGAAAIKAAGYAGAVRYLGFPDRRKCATAAELADFTAHQIGMAGVFEDTLTTWRGGRAAGAHSASLARAHAHAIGFPPGRPLFFAVDQDVVKTGEFGQALDYLRGAGDYLGGAGMVGVYGEADVIDRARDAEVAAYFWQTAAWSRGRRTAAHLFQHVGTVRVGGVACDTNDVLADDWGQHNFVRGGGWLMALTDAQQQQLYTWVKDLTEVIGSYYQARGEQFGDAAGHMIGKAIFDIESRPAVTLDEKTVAAVAAQIQAGLQLGATPEQVDQAVRAAFARAGQPATAG